MALRTPAGVYPHASLFSFPAAMTTITPRAMASLTTSVMPRFSPAPPKLIVTAAG